MIKSRWIHRTKTNLEGKTKFLNFRVNLYVTVLQIRIVTSVIRVKYLYLWCDDL